MPVFGFPYAGHRVAPLRRAATQASGNLLARSLPTQTICAYPAQSFSKQLALCSALPTSRATLSIGGEPLPNPPEIRSVVSVQDRLLHLAARLIASIFQRQALPAQPSLPTRVWFAYPPARGALRRWWKRQFYHRLLLAIGNQCSTHRTGFAAPAYRRGKSPKPDRLCGVGGPPLSSGQVARWALRVGLLTHSGLLDSILPFLPVK
jgi:hypothetical protein